MQVASAGCRCKCYCRCKCRCKCGCRLQVHSSCKRHSGSARATRQQVNERRQTTDDSEQRIANSEQRTANIEQRTELCLKQRYWVRTRARLASGARRYQLGHGGIVLSPVDWLYKYFLSKQQPRSCHQAGHASRAACDVPRAWRTRGARRARGAQLRPAGRPVLCVDRVAAEGLARRRSASIAHGPFPLFSVYSSLHTPATCSREGECRCRPLVLFPDSHSTLTA